MHHQAPCVNRNEEVLAGQCLTPLFTRLGTTDSHTAHVDVMFFPVKFTE